MQDIGWRFWRRKKGTAHAIRARPDCIGLPWRSGRALRLRHILKHRHIRELGPPLERASSGQHALLNKRSKTLGNELAQCRQGCGRVDVGFVSFKGEKNFATAGISLNPAYVPFEELCSPY